MSHLNLDRALLVTLGLSRESADIVMTEIEELRKDVGTYQRRLAKALTEIDELNQNWIDENV